MTKKIGIYRDVRNKGRPWVVRWFGEYDPKTKKQRRYTESFRLKVEAEEFATEQATAFKEGQQRDRPEEVLLGDFCKDWLNSRKKDLRPESVKLYKNTIQRLLNYFGECTLLTITPKAAAKFIGELERLDGERGELSNWSRHKTLRNCKTIFETAFVWEIIPKNPFQKVKSPKLICKSWYYVTPAQYKRLLEVAPSLRWKARYALAYTGGLRFGELFSLTWEDVDFENQEVEIKNRQGTATTPEFYIKNYEKRTIKLPKATIDILEDLRAYNELTDQTPYVLLDQRQYETAMAKWRKYREQGRAWRNQDMVNNIGREFCSHLIKAKINPVGTLSIHTLRKCAGKNWAMVNRDPSVTQKLMGHSSITTTMKYYDQVTDEDRARAAEAIDLLVANSKKE